MAGPNVNHYADATHGKACTVQLVQLDAKEHVTSKARAVRWFKNAATFQRRQHQREVIGLITFDGSNLPTFRMRLGPFGGVQIQRVEQPQ